MFTRVGLITISLFIATSTFAESRREICRKIIIDATKSYNYDINPKFSSQTLATINISIDEINSLPLNEQANYLIQFQPLSQTAVSVYNSLARLIIRYNDEPKAADFIKTWKAHLTNVRLCAKLSKIIDEIPAQ